MRDRVLACLMLIASCSIVIAQPMLERVAWIAEEIAGQPVIDTARSSMMIANGRVSGRGACNRYTGPSIVQGSAIRFGPIASTKMACSPALMEQESRFFQMLEAVRGYSFDNGLLILTDTGGNRIGRLGPGQPDTK